MRSTGTVTFALFVIVVLAAIFWLMHGRGQTQWGLVAVLLGILVLRVVLFVINLRQQRHNAEQGKGPVRIETRLGLNDEEQAPEQAPEQATEQATEPPSEPPSEPPASRRP
jgi:Na+/melibiose symporter-like transporter